MISITWKKGLFAELLGGNGYVCNLELSYQFDSTRWLSLACMNFSR